MDLSEFIVKAKVFFYALRHKQTEKVLVSIILVLSAVGSYLRVEWREFAPALYAAYFAYAVSIAAAVILLYRVWRLAAPPPAQPAGPVPNAIKGLLPFTILDGHLFARLGRQMELQRLLSLAQNDQIAIAAIRGESGAGKTSLLQAGLAYALEAGHCIYWEAVSEKSSEALLYAIHSHFATIDSLDALPDASTERCVLILDQFEQLRVGQAEAVPIFALLERVAKAPKPIKFSIIVSFRNEYASHWLDIETSLGFRAEQMPIRLLAPRIAGDALVTLADEAGFSLDQALVQNFISSVSGREGVSAVDVAIGVLSLANFVQQNGSENVGFEEYRIAGGAEGLLLDFAEQKLQEIPEAIRAPVLKGIVLTLVDSSNQRVASGDDTAAIPPCQHL